MSALVFNYRALKLFGKLGKTSSLLIKIYYATVFSANSKAYADS